MLLDKWISQKKWWIMMELSKKHHSSYCHCPTATSYLDIFKYMNGSDNNNNVDLPHFMMLFYCTIYRKTWYLHTYKYLTDETKFTMLLWHESLFLYIELNSLNAVIDESNCKW